MRTLESSQYFELIGRKGRSIEIEVVVSFTYLPGCAETGPSYACGGTPAEPACVEDVEIIALYEVTHVGGRYVRDQKLDMPEWLSDFCMNAIDEDELLQDALEREEVE